MIGLLQAFQNLRKTMVKQRRSLDKEREEKGPDILRNQIENEISMAAKNPGLEL
jgi:hypothetical protein